MAIIVKLDQIMLKRRVKLLELADRIGITYANLSNLKNAKVNAIRFSTLESICRELNCQPGDILEYLDDEVINYIDSMCEDEASKEGALNRLYAYASMNGENIITLDLAKECFNLTKELTVDMIINTVAEYFNIDSDTLKNAKKGYDTMRAKGIALYLCRTETTVSFKELCEIFNTNPENLMYSCDIVSELLPKEKTYKDDYTNILNKLKKN